MRDRLEIPPGSEGFDEQLESLVGTGSPLVELDIVNAVCCRVSSESCCPAVSSPLGCEVKGDSGSRLMVLASKDPHVGLSPEFKRTVRVGGVLGHELIGLVG